MDSGFLIHVADPAFINPDTDVTASENLFRLMVLRMTGLKMAHQRCYTCTVFTGQPVCQFPEHHSVDITEYVRFKINELVERSLAFQFPVELFNHIDFAFTVIA